MQNKEYIDPMLKAAQFWVESQPHMKNIMFYNGLDWIEHQYGCTISIQLPQYRTFNEKTVLKPSRLANYSSITQKCIIYKRPSIYVVLNQTIPRVVSSSTIFASMNKQTKHAQHLFQLLDKSVWRLILSFVYTPKTCDVIILEKPDTIFEYLNSCYRFFKN